MNFYCLTLFADMVRQAFNSSVTGRAADAGLLSLNTIDIRDFSKDKHKKADDYPYGGGAGLVMKADCVYDAYLYALSLINKKRSAKQKIDAARQPKLFYLSPRGRKLDSKLAMQLAECDDIILLCGHYEGIDERALEKMKADFISIGDYVITGGELAALVVMDAVSRFVPGVLGNSQSAYNDSFCDGLLEYPQYTRPDNFLGMAVPEILKSGDHKKIEAYRKDESLRITKKYRPDLYDKYMKEGGS